MKRRPLYDFPLSKGTKISSLPGPGERVDFSYVDARYI